jgi:ribosomal protein S18 acetylase RimI-like enzyme
MQSTTELISVLLQVFLRLSHDVSDYYTRYYYPAHICLFMQSQVNGSVVYLQDYGVCIGHSTPWMCVRHRSDVVTAIPSLNRIVSLTLMCAFSHPSIPQARHLVLLPQIAGYTQHNPAMSTMKLIAAAAALLLILSPLATCWYIASPRSIEEWKGLASVVAESFDSPKANATAFDKARWGLFEKSLREQDTYNQLVNNARKMRGMKYSVLMAKDRGRVVGAAEIGVKFDGQAKRPTIGSLCVDPGYRRLGIGSALVSKCEQVVGAVWDDKTIYAEVDIENNDSLQLFLCCGYVTIEADPILVEVRRGGKSVYRPHYHLYKNMDQPDTNTTSTVDTNATSSSA